jgi:hypothetical protein
VEESHLLRNFILLSKRIKNTTQLLSILKKWIPILKRKFLNILLRIWFFQNKCYNYLEIKSTKKILHW